MNYYKSKADKSMTQLSEAYGQIVGEREIVSERTIATYEGGTERPVVQEVLGALAGAAATGAASALGGKAMDAITGNEDQESEGQGGPAQDFEVGSFVEIDESQGGGSGEIVDISTTEPGMYWIETDDDSTNVRVHRDFLTRTETINVEDEPGAWTAGRTGL
tara:strand:- start:3984 stop:4469 length:486 start_codon:yes stop_codon:yes gene_type:complete